jgi:GntR family transcriptional regulator
MGGVFTVYKQNIQLLHTIHYIQHPRTRQAGNDMRILISNSSPDPIYQQIVRQIKGQIIAGDLPEGSPLPSIRKLAHELQISVITTKRAYEELDKEGLIDTVGGKGTFVASQNQEFLREKRMKLVEGKLSEALGDARLLGMSRREVGEMVDLLWEEEG